jgi:hypothetical protein
MQRNSARLLWDPASGWKNMEEATMDPEITLTPHTSENGLAVDYILPDPLEGVVA